jgi:hypothetical protein
VRTSYILEASAGREENVDVEDWQKLEATEMPEIIEPGRC